MASSRISAVIKSRNVSVMPAVQLRPSAQEPGLFSEAAYRLFIERFDIEKCVGTHTKDRVIAEGYSTRDGGRILAFHILRSEYQTGVELLKAGTYFRGCESWDLPCWNQPHLRKTVVMRAPVRQRPS